jgi:hypothetical protein
MSPTSHARLAWGIALASLALWAASAPAAFGQFSSWSAAAFSQASADDQGSGVAAGDATTQQGAPCPPQPSAVADSAPPAPTPAPTGATQATYRLCGADPQIERAIEQLVAGRSFSTTLMSRGDGCADLLVKVAAAQASSTTGRISSNLTVSLGSGQSLSVQIVSENGATHAHIG